MQSRREFLITGLGIGISALLRPIATNAGTTNMAKLRAGAGRANIVFSDDLYPLDGFVGEHDPLAARVLLLDDGSKRMCVTVIDLTSIPEEIITAMKSLLTAITGVPAENAIICASHTFSTPHVFSAGEAPPGTDTARNDAMRSAFETALRIAATQAIATLQPARLGFGSGTSRVNINRDAPTSHGWWLGANEAGFTDPFLGVLRVDSLDGKPLAILMNFSVQSSITDGSQRETGGRLISADLAGAAARYVETHYGSDAVALFLVGAAGDQAPYLQANRHVVNEDGSVGQIDLHEAGLILVDLLGERLGADVVRVARHIVMEPATALDIRRESVEVTSQDFSPSNKPVGPVSAFDYKIGEKQTVPVVLIRIGDMALVGMQPELAASIGAQIRADSPYRQTLVATMVDGAAKYMPDSQSYDRFTYEARSSPYAKGAAEAAAAAIISKLKQMDTSKTKED
ncbi:hypothetical protein [Brenneria roseae]|uniref:hypothetical protein n=1 Tax=Brenneria roseae TaxID=1509241 RepID=UPI001FFAC52E|nr:hypothetical protein [Brenneria roseae]